MESEYQGQYQGHGSGSLFALENNTLTPRFMKCASSPDRIIIVMTAIIIIIMLIVIISSSSAIPPTAFFITSYLNTSKGLLGFSIERLKLCETLDR